jgi:hypothetical protein
VDRHTDCTCLRPAGFLNPTLALPEVPKGPDMNSRVSQPTVAVGNHIRPLGGAHHSIHLSIPWVSPTAIRVRPLRGPGLTGRLFESRCVLSVPFKTRRVSCIHPTPKAPCQCPNRRKCR